MPPAVAAAPLSLHRSHSFLTGIEDKAATDGYQLADGYEHGIGEESRQRPLGTFGHPSSQSLIVHNLNLGLLQIDGNKGKNDASNHHSR